MTDMDELHEKVARELHTSFFKRSAKWNVAAGLPDSTPPVDEHWEQWGAVADAAILAVLDGIRDLSEEQIMAVMYLDTQPLNLVYRDHQNNGLTERIKERHRLIIGAFKAQIRN